ncbi:MAG: lytic transglycosylase domain-containing protein [Myxococcales bacterium]|nr:lytic transglycosylase domain-containing protein [Myxococcales bacterium]
MARALDLRLTVWRGSGRVVHAAHCREHRGGCRARIAAMARLFATVSRRHGVDPFLLAAVALRESGLNPFAEGGAGERGIVQLHPRGVGSRVRFVRNDAYRSRCRRSADACQEEVLDAGAALIAASMERCGGAAEGLGAYNTGRCGETGYSRRVLRERLRLLRLAKTRPTPSAPALLD